MQVSPSDVDAAIAADAHARNGGGVPPYSTRLEAHWLAGHEAASAAALHYIGLNVRDAAAVAEAAAMPARAVEGLAAAAGEPADARRPARSASLAEWYSEEVPQSPTAAAAAADDDAAAKAAAAAKAEALPLRRAAAWGEEDAILSLKLGGAHGGARVASGLDAGGSDDAQAPPPPEASALAAELLDTVLELKTGTSPPFTPGLSVQRLVQVERAVGGAMGGAISGAICGGAGAAGGSPSDAAATAGGEEADVAALKTGLDLRREAKERLKHGHAGPALVTGTPIAEGHGPSPLS